MYFVCKNEKNKNVGLSLKVSYTSLINLVISRELKLNNINEKKN